MRQGRPGTALVVTVTLALSLACLDGLAIWWMRDNGTEARFVVVDDLAEVDPPQSFERGSAGFAEEFPGSDPLEILASVMNSVESAGEGPSGDCRRALEHVQGGGGLLCAGMATLYAAALHDAGYRVRIVSLRRNFFDRYDSHTTVEVYLDGGWRLIDPTFGISWVRDGRILDAWQVRTAVLNGDRASVSIVSHGDYAYPASLGEYNMDWAPLFNNVRVYASGESDPSLRGKAAKFPPIRYWIGPRYYLQFDPNHPPSPLVRYHNGLYAAFVLVIPVTIGVLFVAAALLASVGHRRGRGPSLSKGAE